MRSQLLTFEHTDPDARVLVLTNMWPHSGNARHGIFVKREIESLIDAGVRCDVMFIRGFRSPLAYPLAAAVLFAWNLAPRRRYKLVHGHGGETALPARFYLRAPVLISYMGTDLLGKPRADATVPLRHRVRRKVLRLHTRMLSATITMSKEMEGLLPRGAQLRNTVIPHGVDSRVFAPQARARVRSVLRWKDTERIALFAADPAVERKRYWLAKAACELAAARMDDLHLKVVTDVPPSEIPLYMNGSDCLLLTSIYEGSPNVVKEAMMCNLPVVATAAGDVTELLEGVEPSAVCDPTPESLASGLLECLSSPRRSNGRAVAGPLAWEPLAERMLAVYRELAPDAIDVRRRSSGEPDVEDPTSRR